MVEKPPNLEGVLRKKTEKFQDNYYVTKKVHLLLGEIEPKQDKNLHSQLFLVRLALLALAHRPRFCLVVGNSGLIVALVIGGAVLTGSEVAISFSGWSL